MKANLSLSKAEARLLQAVLDDLCQAGEGATRQFFGLSRAEHRRLAGISWKADRTARAIDEAEAKGLS